MNFEQHDARLLSVWQAFQFKLEDSEKTSSERADAARSLMFQVHNLFQRGTLNSQQYQSLLNYYEKQYCNIVDEQSNTKGLNNFAEQSIALTSGFRNDSRNWKSSLTFESLDDFNISKIPAKDYESKIPKAMESLQPQDITENDVPTSKSNTTIEKSNLVFTRATAGPSAKALFSKDSRMNGSTSRRNEVERNGQENYANNSTSSYMTYKSHPSRHKQKLKEQTVEEREEENDDNEFVTARQQFIINEKKKKGRNESCQNMGSYGAVKKSLGYRRGPSTRFVPPVRNQDCNDEIVESYQPRKDSRTKNSLRSKNESSATDSDEITDERLKGIEPKMVELINNEIMDHGPPVDWNDIAGLEFAKTVIKEIVVWPMLRPDIFKGLRGPPKGLLLFGPPGTGKTLIGKCIASQSKATFFSISASSLTSKWVGEGEKMVRALFAVARCHQPAVIFIDEIDSLLSQRSDGEHDSSRKMKTEFLVQFDGATTRSEDQLLVIGATNRPQEIDEAARRRMVKRLYIPLPEGEARRQIITNLLKEQHYSLSEEDFGNLVKRSKGYSGSDMSNLCREAALGPIRSISGDIRAITPDQVRKNVTSATTSKHEKKN